MQRLRIGIVGLGAVAQLVHLPNLDRLGQRFAVRHVCDLSADLAAGVALRLPGDVRHSTDYRALCDDAELDAVLVLSSGSHAAPVLDLLAACKHVFVEKPLCLTLAEADRIGAAQRAADRVVLVGYMKLYDALMPKARAALASFDDIRFIAMTVLHPTPARQQAHRQLLRAHGSVAAALIQARELEVVATREAIGELPPLLGWIYRDIALGSLVHQVALLRGLIDELPGDYPFVDAWPLGDAAVLPTDPPSIVAHGGLGERRRFELRWLWAPDHARYEENVEIVASSGRIALSVPPPYPLDQESVLEVDRASATGPYRETFRSGHQSGFVRELIEFHERVTAGPPFASDVAEARRDTASLQALVGGLARRLGYEPRLEAERS